jgi:demethylmenaquinone methyltransferase/2-methoxy-6-polyprenyl-1,4-benzoquinol methylase
MVAMQRNDREFFNALANSWDSTRAHNPDLLTQLVKRTGVQPNQRVLDIGCGTGVLIPYLHAAVGENGTIVGIDIADNMVEIATAKAAQFANVTLQRADVMVYRSSQRFDHVTCLNFFPHIQDKAAFFRQVLDEWLIPGGWLHVFHDLSRAQVNAIHGESKTVKDDRLASSDTVGGMFVTAGFQTVTWHEDQACYFVQGKKPLIPL